MDEKNHEKIKQILKECVKPVILCTLPQLIYAAKKKGFDEKEVLAVVENLKKEGEIYSVPESLCLM